MKVESKAPLDQFSARMREVWQAGLGVDIADDTDFFDAGGDSLAAIRIIAAIDAAYGARVPLRVLFDTSRFDEFVKIVLHALPAKRLFNS